MIRNQGGTTQHVAEISCVTNVQILVQKCHFCQLYYISLTRLFDEFIVYVMHPQENIDGHQRESIKGGAKLDPLNTAHANSDA